jgi:hypothetical protein
MAVALAFPAGLDPDRGLGRAALYSGALHAALLVIALVGLPQLIKPLPTEDRPLIVEALPLSSITNAPPPSAAPPTPQIQQAQRPQPPEPPRPQPQVAPPPPVPTPPPPQAQTPPPQPATPPPPTPPAPPQPAQSVPIPPPPAPPQPNATQPAAEALPAPVPAPPAPPPPPAPVVAAAPPQPTTTPPPPPQQPPPQPQTRTPPTPPQRQQPAFSLDNVLRDVSRQRPQPQQQQQAAAPGAASANRASNAPHNPLLPLSMTEEDAIRQRVVQNWNVDVGAKGIETFVVTLKVFVTADGSVQRADILETQGSPPDALRAFADGARRAALRASPLPIPAARAQQLTNGNLELRFSAREMLGMR